MDSGRSSEGSSVLGTMSIRMGFAEDGGCCEWNDGSVLASMSLTYFSHEVQNWIKLEIEWPRKGTVNFWGFGCVGACWAC